jgi:transglutaminase-like putative cysteine protease
MRIRHLSGLLLGAMAGATLAAPVTVLRQDVVYEVAADGTWTTEVSVATRVNEQAAVAAVGQLALSYSDSLQQLEILGAYTTTKDGQRLDVAPDKILAQAAPASAGAPSFSDYKVRTVVFPQVEVGATVSLRHRLKQVKPFLPGVLTLRNSFPRTVEAGATTVTLRVPQAMKLAVSAREMEGGAIKSPAAGMREWRWTYSNPVPLLPEPGAVAAGDFSPGVLISNLDDYTALAAAYMAGAAPAARVTPAVQQLADQVTAGITDKRAQAEALYNWVGTNIRYVAIAIGAGGFVPHQADEILAARYGDCKDKTTLLTALLHARGIRAMPVLISADNSYALPERPVLSAFNHAITYLPDFDLFVDSTSGFVPFGTLAGPLRDKQALVAGDAGMKPALLRTPPQDPGRDRVLVRTTAALAGDGSISGTNRVEFFGTEDPGARSAFGRIPAEQLARMGQQLLGATGQNGEAKLTVSELRDLKQPAWIAFDFSVPMRLNVPGPGALPQSVGITLASPATFVASILRQPERKQPFVCPGGTMEEQQELKLPDTVRITSLPAGADIKTDYGHYSASYEVKDGVLRFTRKLESRRPRTVCGEADFAELRKFANAVNQELRRQILYE